MKVYPNALLAEKLLRSTDDMPSDKSCTYPLAFSPLVVSWKLIDVNPPEVLKGNIVLQPELYVVLRTNT